MKTLRILGLLLIAGVLFSCEKDIEKEVKQDVVFGINEMDPTLLKSDEFDILCPDLEPEFAYVKLSVGGLILEFNPEVIFVEGKPYTKAIRLDPGTYEVIEFYLYTMVDGNEVIIMATPIHGSKYDLYVNKALQNDEDAFTFVVDSFEKLQVEIDVLCYLEANYLDFGFFWFQINRIVIREICFFGDFCMKEAADYANSLYADQEDFPGSGYYDASAIFNIVAKKNGEPVPHHFFDEGVFTNAEWFGEGAPLCVQYPDDIDVDGETFTFELQILVRVGSDFEYVTFHTWTFDDNHEWNAETENGIQTDAFGVVDFVLGSCNFNPSPETLVLPPYQNLPETANANIVWEQYANSGYWKMKINSVNPDGSYDFPAPSNDWYLGWCGDATKTITGGDGTSNAHNFFIYSSMYDENWPTGTPFTIEHIAKVNWLFNNLHLFFTNVEMPEGMFMQVGDLGLDEDQSRDLQHAIWMILGYAYSSNTALWPAYAQGGGLPSTEANAIVNAASTHGDFVPLPGGWAAVLMVKNDLPQSFQIIFTMVDP